MMIKYAYKHICELGKENGVHKLLTVIDHTSLFKRVDPADRRLITAILIRRNIAYDSSFSRTWLCVEYRRQC